MDNDNAHTEDKSLIVEAPKKNIFKENWLKTDICCEKCGQVTERQRGMTKQNIKRLFSVKFTMEEVIWTLVIIMVLISAYAYQHDTAICREYAKQIQSNFTPVAFAPTENRPTLNFNITTITNETG